MDNNRTIRKEQPGDIDEIWAVNTEAFGSEAEANLVNTLRKTGIPYISLVCEIKRILVGHILFTPVELIGDTSGLRITGLGPMAVIPELQNRGIGSSLVRAGVQQSKAESYDAIVVLGHPGYYPRFGFAPSMKFNISSEYDVPDEMFMILELKNGSLRGKRGIIRYHDAFGKL